MAVIALILAGLSAVGTVAYAVISQLSIKHIRNQANLALRQLHDVRAPEWGEVELVESRDGSYTVNLPLVSDIRLDSVKLEILVNSGQTAGLCLDDDEGAAGGLALGGTATWQLRVNAEGDPTTRARVTSTAGKDKWSVLIDLPFSMYQWVDITKTIGF